MSGGGTSSAQQQTETKSKTKPWKPTIPALENIIGQISGQLGNTKPTEYETAALDQIRANAQQGNPFTAQITSLANDLFTGGPDRSGIVNDAYANYQKQSQPYLDPNFLNPYTNPAFQGYMDTVTNDVTDRVNSMFAGAGRDLSGMNMQTLARGIAEGTAPIFANQYNQNVANQRGAMDNLFSAGGQTAGLLSGMDQQSLSNRAQGVGAAAEALGSQNYGANQMLQAEAARRGLPLNNIGNVSSLLLPIAGLGQQSAGTATSTGTQTMSPVQQALGWTQVASNFGKGVSGMAGGVQQLGSIFSDRRLKEDIKPVGKLDNGLTVYSYRYKAGGPVHIGLMADEVEQIAPDAVGNIGGYKTVRYDLAVA